MHSAPSTAHNVGTSKMAAALRMLYLTPVPAAQIIYPDCDHKTMSTFHSSLWGNKHGDPRFFSQVFAKNSLIKNIFEEEKSLIVEHDFGGEISFVFGIVGSRRGLQANHRTVRKSAICSQPGDQKRFKWSNTAYLNKRSFMFKIRFCMFHNNNNNNNNNSNNTLYLKRVARNSYRN